MRSMTRFPRAASARRVDGLIALLKMTWQASFKVIGSSSSKSIIIPNPISRDWPLQMQLLLPSRGHLPPALGYVAVERFKQLGLGGGPRHRLDAHARDAVLAAV